MAAVISNMDYLNQLVLNALEETVLDIEPLGNDKKMYNIAVEDLKLYLAYKWKMDDYSNYRFREKFIRYLTEEGEVVQVFINNWIKNWYRKWKQRVKIIVKDLDWTVDKRQITETVKRGSRIMPFADVKRYMVPLSALLIENGEIACVKLLAEQMLLREVAKRSVAPKTLKEKIEFADHVMRMLKSVITVTGPLLFIKLNKFYFR